MKRKRHDGCTLNKNAWEMKTSSGDWKKKGPSINVKSGRRGGALQRLRCEGDLVRCLKSDLWGMSMRKHHLRGKGSNPHGRGLENGEGDVGFKSNVEKRRQISSWEK